MTTQKVIETIKNHLQNPDGSFLSLDEENVETLAQKITDLDDQSNSADNDPFLQIPEFLVNVEPSDTPTREKLFLGARLIFEELLEYAEACNTETRNSILHSFSATIEDELDKMENEAPREYDRLAMYDAQIDILYVLGNAAYFCNLHDKMMDGFTEVHSNNMKKVNLSSSDVVSIFANHNGRVDELTIHAIGNELARDSAKVWVTNQYGKILKPQNHPKPNLIKVLDNA